MNSDRFNKSERFNMPTAFETSVEVWKGIESGSEYWHAGVDYIQDFPGRRVDVYEYELFIADILGTYLMGGEL